MNTQLPGAARIMPQAPDAGLAARFTRSTAVQFLKARQPDCLAQWTPGARALMLRVMAVAWLALPASPLLAQQPQGVPQQGLPKTDLTAGMHRIVAEVAADHSSRATGLMHRRSLAPNHGMLFVFAEKSPQCFWMRNTLIALSIAFLDDDGRIVNIEDMAPLTENSHCSKEPVRFALEMEQGWFSRRGVGAGDRLTGRDVFKPR